jgi:hypothetical protein
MKLNRRLAIALGITALFGVAVVQAEELKQYHVTFAFEAVGQKLEAGTYGAVDNGGLLLVENIATGQGVYILPVPTGLTNSGKSSITLDCNGSQCFLNKIQFSGSQRRVYQDLHDKAEELLSTGVNVFPSCLAWRWSLALNRVSRKAA